MLLLCFLDDVDGHMSVMDNILMKVISKQFRRNKSYFKYSIRMLLLET